jgi:hypothetical protein
LIIKKEFIINELKLKPYDTPDNDTKFFVSLDSAHARKLIPRIYLDKVKKMLEESGEIVVLEY